MQSKLVRILAVRFSIVSLRMVSIDLRLPYMVKEAWVRIWGGGERVRGISIRVSRISISGQLNKAAPKKETTSEHLIQPIRRKREGVQFSEIGFALLLVFSEFIKSFFHLRLLHKYNLFKYHYWSAHRFHKKGKKPNTFSDNGGKLYSWSTLSFVCLR